MPDSPAAEVTVWRPALRLAHWTLAASVLACLLLFEGGTWHERLGYTALAIAIWRVLTGWVGRRSANPQQRHARFASFVRSPAATLAYARALRHGTEPRHLGHNPLGGWMVLALLAAVLLAGVSGAVYVTDAFWGDAAVYRLHQLAGWALAVLVPLHLGGVALTSWLQHENLVKAMLTGTKRAAGPGDID